jgi:phosphoglycerate dehydrogenase-like enzyme
MAPEVAEHALAMVLALTRRLDVSIREQCQSRWAEIRRDRPPIGLTGLTLGIVGYGHIGRAIAERARPFGLTVIGLRRGPSPPDGRADEILGIDDLPDVLRRADIIILALPLTEQTRGLFDRTRFQTMRTSAVFVNVGRGAVVDETALVDALKAGTIAGAASDVFAEEPLPPASPLWQAPNLVVSPHIAGASQDVWVRVIDLIFDNLERLRRGETPVNEVDKSSGY